MRKIKIFLGDIVHNLTGEFQYTFPLQVGLIGEYARKHYPDEIEVRYFKRPELIIDAIRRENPDIVGLSYYIWNKNLNNLVFNITKMRNPDILTIGGGPNITNLNCHQEGLEKFFSEAKHCDIYVLNQGENGFLQIIDEYVNVDQNTRLIKQKSIAGCFINASNSQNKILIGEAVPLINDLDEIPSPYLNGAFDEFFNYPYIPIIETNRSCPYRCTYCAWGIGTKQLTYYSTERVKAEIEYIAKRCKRAGFIWICDANFSILERDGEIAEKFYECYVKYRFPAHVMVQWNKSNPQRIMEVAKRFKGLADVVQSFQSIHEPTLKAIKRVNLPVETVKNLTKDLNNEGIHVISELIVGLPCETKQSHIDGIKTVIDIGADVCNYNLHIIPGAQMDTVEEREKYFKDEVFRLHDQAYGIYDGVKVFETQEVVNETNTMTKEDLRSFRFIHFLLQFLLQKKWYIDFLYFQKYLGYHPMDFILEIDKACKEDNGRIGGLYKTFKMIHDREESFKTREELIEYWSREENFSRLKNGDYGKLNSTFSYKIILDCHDDFNLFLFNLTKRLALIRSVIINKDFNVEKHMDKTAEILRFNKMRTVSFNHDFTVVESKKEMFKYDILAWINGNYNGYLDNANDADIFEYEFYLDDAQKQYLLTSLSQAGRNNLNYTLRKIHEHTNPVQFIYRVRLKSGIHC